MFTAKIQRTEEPQAGLDVYVDFYNDGVFAFTENVIPQDRQGFLHWKESRLKSLNTRLALKTELTPNLDITGLGVTTLTQAELDKQAWFAKYNELEQLEKIAAKNFLTGARLTNLNTRISSAKSYLDTNIKVEYLDFI
jgi:hypothetical protein